MIRSILRNLRSFYNSSSFQKLFPVIFRSPLILDSETDRKPCFFESGDVGITNKAGLNLRISTSTTEKTGGTRTGFDPAADKM